MEIQRLSLVELTEIDSMSINGGNVAPTWVKWLKGSVWGIALGIIADNWGDIKSGAIDGWEDAMND